MTEVAGAGIDDDQGWSERLAWAYGLTAPDPAERAAALVRLARARRAADAALRRVHRASQPTRWLRRKARDWAAADKAYYEAAGRSLPEALELAAADHDHQVRAKLIDLVDLVVQRSYRCKDREYVRVARAVDGDELRDRLRRAHRSENPTARLHAGYVLRLLDRPEIPNTRHVWRTWLAGTLT
ncbi:hypothetical protein [Streptomyces sp. NPDC060065]|uniref:hypothetical protein n=1 Tax=Streptomyces sp. NPDC060065 TaxID=3347050 RepID=UPI003685DF91